MVLCFTPNTYLRAKRRRRCQNPVPELSGENDCGYVNKLNLFYKNVSNDYNMKHFHESTENMCKICFRIQWGTWWPHQDLHSAVGLRFQWGGSHTNRTLLRCLGMDTRHIVSLAKHHYYQ